MTSKGKEIYNTIKRSLGSQLLVHRIIRTEFDILVVLHLNGYIHLVCLLVCTIPLKTSRNYLSFKSFSFENVPEDVLLLQMYY
ncbi:unnamed protein product [Brugia timori]|uniref:Ovule protein n=1 Tax=Brugia timori TaxID=42155 RepID=A0A0R3R0D8_9BILA|nr:unnamed protein product [Brugia timori]